MRYLFIVLALLLVAGCVQIPEMSSNKDISQDDLKKFASAEELRAYLETNDNSGDIRTFKGGVMMEAVADSGAPSAAAGESGLDNTGSDYTSTNTQYENVDEADFIKNDDKYIYIISNNRLVIFEAAGEDSKKLSETKMDADSEWPNVRNMLLKDNKIIVFADKSIKTFSVGRYDIRPYPSYKQATEVIIYDVSDRENPEILNTYTIDGSYYDSRMIEGIVYTIAQKSTYDRYIGFPEIASDSQKIVSEVYYFDNPEDNYVLNTIASIDIDTDKIIDSQSFLMGYANTLMVSEKAIYIAYQKQNYWCRGIWCPVSDGVDNEKTRFYEVILPNLKGELKSDVQEIIDKKFSDNEEWNQISEVLIKFYEEIGSEDIEETYKEMFADIEDAAAEYDAKKALEQSKTTIHKIDIEEGFIEYKNKAEVSGRLLNQFSMDENEGYLRLATTIDLWVGGESRIYNNVYVLDDNMDKVGTLEKIAEKETIYSTRFISDKLYMVTFERIDPFFVIDLSNPEAPEVLGYLKIPGFSQYLHPIDENTILGIGKNTGENDWGGISTKGVKISLFDVSDFKNPKELDSYEIGKEGSDTPILYEHKAFTYSKSRNQIVLPVMEVTDREKKNEWSYNSKIWNGAYVFEVGENLELKGKVEHSKSESEYLYWMDQASVTRSIYIGDALYTVSNKYLKVNDAETFDELKEFDLPQYEYPQPIPYGKGIADSGVAETVVADVVSAEN